MMLRKYTLAFVLLAPSCLFPKGPCFSATAFQAPECKQYNNDRSVKCVEPYMTACGATGEIYVMVLAVVTNRRRRSLATSILHAVMIAKLRHAAAWRRWYATSCYASTCRRMPQQTRRYSSTLSASFCTGPWLQPEVRDNIRAANRQRDEVIVVRALCVRDVVGGVHPRL